MKSNVKMWSGNLALTLVVLATLLSAKHLEGAVRKLQPVTTSSSRISRVTAGWLIHIRSALALTLSALAPGTTRISERN